MTLDSLNAFSATVTPQSVYWKFISTAVHVHKHQLQDPSVIYRSNVFVFFFFALRPKSTAMVIAGRSVRLTTLFPGQA